jgi:hypothetical protein
MIQAVLFPLEWTSSKCRRWLKSHDLKAIKKVHVTSNYRRYRIQEPIKGVEYRIKKLDNGVAFVMALQTPSEPGSLQGGGRLVDQAKTVVNVAKTIYSLLPSARSNAPPGYRKFVEQYGTLKIVNFKVCRQPIYSVLEKIGNLVSLGKWNIEKNKLGYDKMFHLFAVLTTENGKEILTEKNEVLSIRLARSNDIGPKTETMNAGNPNMSLGDIVNKTAQRQGRQFYTYDGFNVGGGGNCQTYVWGLLTSSGLTTEALRKFVTQNATTLLPEFLKNAARKVTDVAAKVDTVLHGNGMQTGGSDIPVEQVPSMPIEAFLNPTELSFDSVDLTAPNIVPVNGGSTELAV